MHVVRRSRLTLVSAGQRWRRRKKGASAKVPAGSADIIAMFEWNDKFSTGIASIDAQHQGLFSIGAELYAAMGAGQGKERMGRILTRLVQYTAAHFAYEERLMQLHGYPDYAAHKAQHDDLTRHVQHFCREFQSGQIGISIPLLHFVDDWLKHHIGQSDQGYAKLLTAKAVA
jgi:hemerythrin